MHADRPARRVVITGRGVISPIGLTVADFWASLMAGRSGIRPIASFDPAKLPVRFGGDLVGFEPTNYFPRKVTRRVDRFAHFALAATREAVEESKLVIDDKLAPRVGVIIGSALGSNLILQENSLVLADRGHRALPPWGSAGTAIDSAASEVALQLKAQGPSSAATSACASSITAIGSAMRTIQYGIADVMVAGGADNGLEPLTIAGAFMSRALSQRNEDPAKACRPFDTDRDGFVLACGSGIVVLEEAEHALRRGAPIIAELLACAETSDAFHPVMPHPEGAGAQRAMRLALAAAGIEPTEVDYINAHGTSTVLNDQAEVIAIRSVFGEHAEKIPISSTKSSTGHILGAAGAVELIACTQAIVDGMAPPTLNCDNPIDPDLNFVANRAQKHDITVAMSNSFGFGGHNGVAVLRRWQE